MEALLILANFIFMFLALRWSLAAERGGPEAARKGLFAYRDGEGEGEGDTALPPSPSARRR